MKQKHKKLGQWLATAICGNDILSSALYVSGIAIIFSGIYAPLVLLLIAGVLYLYKKVYTEVVEALPVNGGAYNCLLNGTSKPVAATAGVMTILSYVATAVISAKVAVEYLHTLLPIPVIATTIGLLLLFAIIVIAGIKDSAKVAFGIFILHILTLISLLVLGAVFYFQGFSFFGQNLAHTGDILTRQGGLMPALYLAFAASLLGVSGFESSANFVEEQKKGVFRKTLRNMLIGVAIVNPLIALVVLNSLPPEAIAAAKDFLLSDVARAIGGYPFQAIVVFDAFLVLSGAVLTSYVGVSGLIGRMSMDTALPHFLSKPSKSGSYPRIIIAFFLLCSSILVATGGELLSLAGVYTISFLGVMSAFAIGNLILKKNRKDLKRTYRAPTLIVFMAFLATFFGIIGNIRINAENLTFFELYFIPAMLIVILVIYYDYVLRFILTLTVKIPFMHRFVLRQFNDVIEGRFVVFIRHLGKLQAILDYINKNETGRHVTFVACKNAIHTDTYQELNHLLPDIQKAGFFKHLKVDVVYYPKEFGPKAVDDISRKLKIHKNRIFIGAIHHEHKFDYDDLGGVRIIH